jgi:hypothetical protein
VHNQVWETWRSVVQIAVGDVDHRDAYGAREGSQPIADMAGVAIGARRSGHSGVQGIRCPGYRGLGCGRRMGQDYWFVTHAVHERAISWGYSGPRGGAERGSTNALS